MCFHPELYLIIFYVLTFDLFSLSILMKLVKEPCYLHFFLQLTANLIFYQQSKVNLVQTHHLHHQNCTFCYSVVSSCLLKVLIYPDDQSEKRLKDYFDFLVHFCTSIQSPLSSSSVFESFIFIMKESIIHLHLNFQNLISSLHNLVLGDYYLVSLSFEGSLQCLKAYCFSFFHL